MAGGTGWVIRPGPTGGAPSVADPATGQPAPVPTVADDALWYETGHAGVRYRPIPRDKTRPLCHALSIDLEDWQQSVFDQSLPVSNRFVASTYRLLELLDEFGVRATFFVLGLAAEKAPSLIRELHACGHEVQTHGYDHTQVTAQDPDEFRRDLRKAKALVEDLTGAEVYGFRAPRFSIVESNLWALDVLADCGFLYDSSIFPMRIRGYGIGGWPRYEHRLRTPGGAELFEVPVATLALRGFRLPLGGGGYFRLFPYACIRLGLRWLHWRGMPAVLYFHPYEVDPDAFRELNLPVPWKTRLHQGLGRRGVLDKLREVLDEFPFAPLRELIPQQRLSEA